MITCFREVQRQHRCVGVVIRCSDASNASPASRWRRARDRYAEAVIDDIADQAVLEPVAKRTVGLDEPAELGEWSPGRARDPRDGGVPRRRPSEATPEHGRVRQHPLRQRVERVDLGCRACPGAIPGPHRASRAPALPRSTRRRTTGCRWHESTTRSISCGRKRRSLGRVDGELPHDVVGSGPIGSCSPTSVTNPPTSSRRTEISSHGCDCALRPRSCPAGEPRRRQPNACPRRRRRAVRRGWPRSVRARRQRSGRDGTARRSRRSPTVVGSCQLQRVTEQRQERFQVRCDARDASC